MATWYTHYRIANALYDLNPVLDKTAFIFGNLAPDSGLFISSLNYDPCADITHYTKGSDKALIKPLRLLDEYLPRVKNLAEYSFILGYFTHLLTDKLYSNFVFKDIIIKNKIDDLKGEKMAHIRNEWQLADALLYKGQESDINLELSKIDLRVSIVEHFSDKHYLDMLNRITSEMNSINKINFIYTNPLDNTNFINNYLNLINEHLRAWLKPNKAYEYLFIDLDNTIFDFSIAEKRALANTYLKYDIEYNQETYDLYDGINHDLWHQLEDGLVDIDTLFYKRFELLLISLKRDHSIAKDMANEYSYQLSLCRDYYEGVEETLISLSKEYKIDIITNGIKEIQIPRINNSVLKDIIHNVYISGDIGYSKPHIEYFKTALNRSNILDKSKVLVVGDGLSADIKGANNAKLDCVWISNLLSTTDLKHELIIDNLTSLKTWLHRKNF